MTDTTASVDEGVHESPAKKGRPLLPSDKRRGASMGFRPTPEIRAKLERAAEKNGRSVSQEIESRLERSFGSQPLIILADVLRDISCCHDIDISTQSGVLQAIADELDGRICRETEQQTVGTGHD